jgi:hypothetical protein
MAPTGRQWRLDLRAGATSLGFVVYNGPLGTVTDGGTATLDTVHNEIRVSAPVSSFAGVLKPGTKLTGFSVTAQLAVQLPDAAMSGHAAILPGGTEDAATAAPTVSYTLGALSCVVPGK